MIDRIVLNEGGGEKAIAVKDWLAIDFVKRVDLVAKRQVSFFEGSTALLARDAVAQLRTLERA